MTVKKKIRPHDQSVDRLRQIGRRIREVRGFDISQEEFAQRVGVSQSQLSKYERGVVAPGSEVLLKIKEEFGASIDWVLTGKK